jgi:elongation factor 1 alpha-like protein
MSDWSKERFDYVKTQVEAFLFSLDFKSDNIIFVPISGLNGINLIEKPTDISNFNWYDGKCLIEAIDSFKDPVRNNNFPTRFMVNDCGQSKIQNLQGFSVFGKTEGGFVIEGKEYLIMPHNIKVKARGN